MLRILNLLQFFLVVHCERRFLVAPGHAPCNNLTWNMAFGTNARCSGLSELVGVASTNMVPGDNVVISVEGDNEYYLNASSYFVVPNVSIAIKGVNLLYKPRIICSLTQALADNLYALRFERSNSVILDGLEFVDCPRSLSFADLLNLTIINSDFRLVINYYTVFKHYTSFVCYNTG